MQPLRLVSATVLNKQASTAKLLIMIKRLIVILFAGCSVMQAQSNFGSTNPEINKLMQDFMRAISQKDSTLFYSLFYDGPVAWTGVYKQQTYASQVKENPKELIYFTDNYRAFIRWIVKEKKSLEEQFYHTTLVCDDALASVNFDYSFWIDGKKSNWGKESWGLIRIDGRWKITSVLFSLELQTVVPEPDRR